MHFPFESSKDSQFNTHPTMYEWKVKPSKKLGKSTAFGTWVKVIGPPHSCKKPTLVPKDIFFGSVWRCDECQLHWEYTGAKSEKLVWEHLSTSDDYAYCVMCKETVTIENRITRVSDSGRKMAQGNCGKCGTKVNRILGKDF